MKPTTKRYSIGLGLALGAGMLAGTGAATTASAEFVARQLAPSPVRMTADRLAEINRTAKPAVRMLKELPAEVAEMVKASKGGISRQNFGQGNFNTIFHYSDTLVHDWNVVRNPYRRTGHFLFELSGGGFARCTAALIARSVGVTAGHCVHDGGTGDVGFIQQAFFYPARKASTPEFPYGFARVSRVATTAGWANEGNLQQGYDVAVFSLETQDGTSNQMGSVVGWYGWCKRNCLKPYWHLTQLGYPGNYYSGQRMTRGEHLEQAMTSGDFIHGSGMQGGSSGGPHIANFGPLNDSSTDLGQHRFRNIIFAVTSWGFVSESFKIQGSSPLSGLNNSNSIISMYNDVCNDARTLHGTSACRLF